MQNGNPEFTPSRRRFLGGMAVGSAVGSALSSALFTTPGLFAEELSGNSRVTPTARLTEGPFYPDKLPLDTDNDLLIINDAITPAVGEISHVSGRILTAAGGPLRNAFVEIWQCDSNGRYHHSRASSDAERDANFQGYGRFLTDANGQYYFRTIKPVPYPGRTPHIHFAISQNGRRIFTTQLLISGHPQNDRDMVFQEVREAAARKTILGDFKPIADSRIGELAVNFDIVLGVTLPDQHDAAIKGGIGPSEMKSGRGPGAPGRGPRPGGPNARGPGGPGGPGPSDRPEFGPPPDRGPRPDREP
jgi:protocatechuate 3,4-dioxygenase beta subunit